MSFQSTIVQGTVDPTGTETFAKEPKFAKLLRELKSPPMSSCRSQLLIAMCTKSR